MISRFEFPDGIEMPYFDENTDVNRILGRILLDNAGDVQPLVPGEYNLTPEIWTGNSYNHQLTVLNNGEGVYRATPRLPGAGFIDRSSRVAFGGRMNPVNAKSPLLAISGGHPRKAPIQIYNLIAYKNILLPG